MLTPKQWAWLRLKLLTEPKWVALQVGLEKIGWYQDFIAPAESPKLADLIDLYAAKPGLSSNEAGRSKLFWKEFTKAVGVETVREINHDAIGKYEAVVQRGGYAPKSILHRYRKIRTVFAHAIKRGRGIEDCRKALDATAMLEVKNAHPLDPRPIQPDQFWAIHDAAEKAEDHTFAAMLLAALNMAAHAGEAAALCWDEVDLKTGGVVTRRPKTGVNAKGWSRSTPLNRSARTCCPTSSTNSCISFLTVQTVESSTPRAAISSAVCSISPPPQTFLRRHRHSLSKFSLLSVPSARGLNLSVMKQSRLSFTSDSAPPANSRRCTSRLSHRSWH
jgi:hypothetical protein